MRKAAQDEYAKGCDLPTVTLKVDFINCSDAEESRMGSSCPLLSSPTGNDPAFPKLTLLAHSHTGGLGASFGSAITESL